MRNEGYGLLALGYGPVEHHQNNLWNLWLKNLLRDLRVLRGFWPAALGYRNDLEKIKQFR